MNSSGIKRGLAVSAISALAVAGIPALASPASAAPGDVIEVASTGTARNAGDQGAVVVLNTRGITAADLELASTALAANEDSGTQSAEIVSATTIASGQPGDLTPNNNLDQITVRITVTTPNAGDTANFVIYEDEDGINDDPATPANERAEDGVDATEARAQVSVQTAGNPTVVDVTPAAQTAPLNQESGAYTVTIRDAAGRLTQLNSGEEIEVSATGGTTTFGGAAAGDNDIDAADILRGTADFTATATGTTGLRTITVGDTNDADVSGSDTATLDVVRAASLTADEIDVVTGADSWTGFGDEDADATDPDNPIAVRVDQSTIRIDIQSVDGADADSTPDDANSTVTLTVNAADGELTFGGKDTITVSTTLDASGRGSITITPDAGQVQEGDDFVVTGSDLPALNFQFQRAAINANSLRVPQSVYSAVDGTVTVTATALDQFGLPVAGAQIDAQRIGVGNANTDAAAQARKTTDAAGQATFTFTDVNANPGSTDNVRFRLFEDQFDAIANDTENTTIRYTLDGRGPDYILTLDGQNTEGSAYSPSSVSVVPLSDGIADNDATPRGDEVVNLLVNGGENNAPVTVSVDNGAVILTGTEDELDEGSATETGVVGQEFEIVGTKSGLVTVTVTTGNRTETAQFTVEAQTRTASARNVTVSGPADAAPGERVTFNAVITDAFGNPVPGVDARDLNVQVSGPGALQDTGALSGANGVIALNVRVDEDAANDEVVTVRVEGIRGNYQFGAAADQQFVGSAAGAAGGLAASSPVATASTTVKAEEEPDTDPVPVTAVATGSNRASDGYDRVRVDVTPADKAAGAAVELWKINKEGKERRVKTKALNDRGFVTWLRVDNNGNRNSRYFAIVRPTDATLEGRSNTVRIR